MRKTQDIIDRTLKYVAEAQDFSPGEFYGSFWSEKAYHGPLLDYHAGGAHHNRGAASAGLAIWLDALKKNDSGMKANAERAFDWLVSRQHGRGGWFEIQNNEKPSDWENTGLEELGTISSAFAVHGLGYALLNGLPPKKSYMDCLLKAGHWFLSIERPQDSGIFPHHERSPYDTLNANAFATESLAVIFRCLEKIYGRRVMIFLQGTRRGFLHTLPLQTENGCYPYRTTGGITINYTALVLWCFLNMLEVLPPEIVEEWEKKEEIKARLDSAASFLRSCVRKNGSLDWEPNETSTAKYGVYTYAAACNVLQRIGGEPNIEACGKILEKLEAMLTSSGLLPMRDRGEEITKCLYHQADMILWLRALP